MQKILALDPKKRPTADEALNADWFWEKPLPTKPVNLPRRSCNELTAKLKRKHERELRMQQSPQFKKQKIMETATMLSSTSSISVASSFATMTFNDTAGRTTSIGTTQFEQQQPLGALGVNNSGNVISTSIGLQQQQQQSAIIQHPPPSPPPPPSLPPIGVHQPVSVSKSSQFFRVDNDEDMEPPPLKAQIDTHGPLTATTAATTTSTSGLRPLSHDMMNSGQQSFQNNNNINNNNITSTQQWHSRDDAFKTGRGGTFTGLDSQDSRKRKSFDDKHQGSVSTDFASSGSFYAEKRSQASSSSSSSSNSHGNGGSNNRNTDSHRYSSSGKDEYIVGVGDARMLVDGSYHNRSYTTSNFQGQQQQHEDRRSYNGKQEQQSSRYDGGGRVRQSHHYHVDNDRQYDSNHHPPQYLQNGKRRYDDAGYNR